MEFVIEGDDWYKKHSKKCKIKKKTAIGGRLTYSFTPTGIGCIVAVRCSCGRELDLTDWKNW